MSKRVMVVDDEPVLREFCALTITKLLQADVEVFSDVESALSRLRHPPTFDLLLIDYIMPQKDGLMLCREARRGALSAQVPIVMLTAATDQANELRSGGADAVLLKPLQPTALAQALAPFLRIPAGTFAPTASDIRADYLRSLPEQATLLERHLQAGDGRAVQKLAHRIKGTSATFGLQAVSQAAAAVEGPLKAGGTLDAASVLALCALLRAGGTEVQ